MITIHQGKPNPHHFVIAQPGNSDIPNNTEIECRHPKTNVSTKGVCVLSWTIPWNDVPDSFCYLSYGMTAYELKKALESTFPDFKKSRSVKFLLISEN